MSIELDPSLSALCQSVIGQLNNYRDPRPNVDQINSDAVVQAGTQLGCNTAQNETTIAVNPANETRRRFQSIILANRMG